MNKEDYKIAYENVMIANKMIQEENKQLKEKIILLEASEPMLEFAKQTYKTNWNELKKWLEEEKNRLARECSSIYEGSLGKTRFVNEDIYNEVKNISNKMQELEGKSE